MDCKVLQSDEKKPQMGCKVLQSEVKNKFEMAKIWIAIPNFT